MSNQEEREQIREKAQKEMGVLQVYGIGLDEGDPKSKDVMQATSIAPGGGGHLASNEASKKAITLAFIPDFSEEGLQSIEEALRSHQRNLCFYEKDKQTTNTNETTLHTRESRAPRTKRRFFSRPRHFFGAKKLNPASTPPLALYATGSVNKHMKDSEEIVKNSKEALESSEVGKVISTLIEQAAFPSVHKENPRLCVVGRLSDEVAATVAAITGREVIYAVGSGNAAINFDDNGDIYIGAAADGGLKEVNPEGKIRSLDNSHLYFPSTPVMDTIMEQDMRGASMSIEGGESLDDSISSGYEETLSQVGSEPWSIEKESYSSDEKLSPDDVYYSEEEEKKEKEDSLMSTDFEDVESDLSDQPNNPDYNYSSEDEGDSTCSTLSWDSSYNDDDDHLQGLIHQTPTGSEHSLSPSSIREYSGVSPSGASEYPGVSPSDSTEKQHPTSQKFFGDDPQEQRDGTKNSFKSFTQPIPQAQPSESNDLPPELARLTYNGHYPNKPKL